MNQSSNGEAMNQNYRIEEGLLDRSATRMSPVRVDVRPALDADVEAAVEVLRRSITEVCLADHQNDAPTLERWLRNKTPERFRSWRSAPDNFLVVAACSGVICGVGAIRQSGDLDLLYVHPSYPRKGIGRALLMVLESRAREWGLPTIRLIASATARPFYEHFGYVFLPDESSPGYGVLRIFYGVHARLFSVLAISTYL